MPVTLVKTAWIDGDLYFYDKNGAEIFHIDGNNRALVMHASAGFTAPLEIDATDIAAGAVTFGKITLPAGDILVGTKTTDIASVLDISAEGAIPVGQGAGETPLAKTLSGDVSMAKTGAVTIAAKAVENTMIAAAAGTVLVGTKTSGDVTALDISAKGAIPVGQGAGETAAAKTLSGDVSMSETGAVTIAAKAVENTMIAAAAGTVLVGTKTSGDVTALDISAKGAIAVGQGAGETAAAKTLSGDVVMDETGACVIQAKAVENTMIAAAAGTVLVGTKTSGDVTALDISAEGALPIGQGAGETAKAYVLSGDVTMTKGGVTAIGAAKVSNAMLAAGAGLGAIIGAGLGNSASYIKSTDGTQNLVALNATKARGVLAIAVVDETFADNGGTQPVFELGETDDIDACWDHTIFVGAVAGTVFVKGWLNTANKAIVATCTKAVTTGLGGVSVTVLALPNS